MWFCKSVYGLLLHGGDVIRRDISFLDDNHLLITELSFLINELTEILSMIGIILTLNQIHEILTLETLCFVIATHVSECSIARTLNHPNMILLLDI